MLLSTADVPLRAPAWATRWTLFTNLSGTTPTSWPGSAVPLDRQHRRGLLTLLERKGTYLKGEAGLGWTFEKRRFLKETNDPSGYAGLEYLRKFRNGIDLTARTRFFPNFG